MYLLYGDSVFSGCGAAVFELWRGVEDLAQSHSNLDAYVSVGGGHGCVRAFEAASPLMMDADTERARLAQEKLFQGADLRIVGEDGDERAETAFLHLHGGGHDIESAKIKGALGNMSQYLRREIVERGFKHSDGGLRCVLRLADGDTQRVGKVFWIARARTVTDLLNTHRRLRAEGRRKSADDRGSCWRDELLLDVRRVCWDITQKIGAGWSWYREASVCAVNGASADVQRRAVPALDVECVDSGAGSDDIDDGIDGADFMKVNFFDADVVNLGLAGSQ